MDETLKNRLVGVAVVTVLAVIFLPMMFEDPVEKKGQEVSQLEIPKKPEVSPSLKTEIIPDKAADVTGNTQPVAAVTEEKAPPKTATVFESDKVTIDAQTPPEKTPAVTHETIAETDKPAAETVELEQPAAKPVKPKTDAQLPKGKPDLPSLPNLDSNYKEKSAPLPTPPSSLTPAGNDNRRWVVQAASLSDEAKAHALRDKLQAQGFSANVDTAVIKGRRVYRVRVGQQANSQQAQATRAKINQSLNLQSIAMPAD